MVKKTYRIYDNETKEFIKEESLTEQQARLRAAIDGYYLEVKE